MAKTKSKAAELKKNLTGPEKDRWDREHDFDYIIQVWNGGEHLRAANLAAEAEFPQSKLDDLTILCPGILDHMPAEPGEERQKGSVPGNPVETEMARFQVDESEVTDLSEQRKEAHDVDAALAKREPAVSGKPDNNNTDGPTMHPGLAKDDEKK